VNLRNMPTVYEDAHVALGGKLAQIIGVGLLLIRGFDHESIALTYKGKAIAIFYPGGVVLRNKGAETPQSLTVLNALLIMHGWTVRDGMLRHCATGHEYPFTEGMVMPLNAKGRYTLPLDVAREDE
jgi:hypothetical protein